jgi:protease-4
MPTPPSEPGWERQLLEKLATETLREKRRSRYWGIFFKLLTFAWLTTALLFLVPDQPSFNTLQTSGKHTALIHLQGIISDTEGVDANRIIAGLRNAFADPDTAAIILRINSPGGLPVQSSHIQKAIVRLRNLHPKVPLYAVVDDVCASGAYYIASAADRIYVNESSIIGSIGVRMDGFGFTDTMQKLGIERRLYTAGKYKGMLDPFSPVTEFEREHTTQILDELHQTFIAAVRAGRGNRLNDDPNLFSGLVWSGQRSIQLGLADAIGNTDSVAREVIKQENIIDFTPQVDPLERLANHLSIVLTGIINRLFSTTFVAGHL